MTTDDLPPGDNAKRLLVSYVHRIESLEEDARAIAADKSEVYKEARNAGFDKGVLRKLITRRRRDRDEVYGEDALLETYERALAEAEAEVGE